MTDFGFAAGPFQMQDLAGIDVGARIRRHLHAIGRTRADGPQSAVPDRLFELGRYGQKTGRGWYRYVGGSRDGIADPEVDLIAAEDAFKRGIQRRAIDDDEILARVTTALANEGRACSTKASPGAPATSTSSTPTASAFRAIAAARCSTRIRSVSGSSPIGSGTTAGASAILGAVAAAGAAGGRGRPLHGTP